MNVQRLFYPILLLSILIILLLWSVQLFSADATPMLQITEFMASNDTTLEDPDEPGDYPDWIEIKNIGPLATDLNGLYLSDDSTDLTKYQIPSSLFLDPDESILFYADSSPEQGDLHTNFSLSSGGEEIVLVDTDGTTIVEHVVYGEQWADVSWGRCADFAEEWRFFAPATPNAPNGICTPVIQNTTFMPSNPSSTDMVTVTTTITDLGSVVSPTLWYSATGMLSSLPLVATGGDMYEGVIPAQADGTEVAFYVSAENSNTATAYDPPLAPTETYIYFTAYTTPTLHITEFMASNETTLEDPDEPGEFPDWIEIYNFGDEDIDLQGMYLSDDSADPTKYLIDEPLLIVAGHYKVFYADDDGTQGVLHTNFTLSAGGSDELLLVDVDGTSVIDYYDFGAQTTDISEGRCFDLPAVWAFFVMPTPHADNYACGPQITDTTWNPLSPTDTDAVTVSATITDSGSVMTATLFYQADGGAFVTVPMTNSAPDQYEAIIPAHPAGTQIDLYLAATDDEFNTVFDPLTAPADLYSYIVDYQPPTLFVNEIMADNDAILEDPDEPGEFPDWFEIYNPTAETIDLNGMYLTDDLSDTTQYLISGTLPITPDGFLIFYADDDDEQGILHTNFKLGASGESVALVGIDGITIVDSYTWTDQQETDVSIGRLPDGSPNWQTLLCASPRASNSGCDFPIYLPIIRND